MSSKLRIISGRGRMGYMIYGYARVSTKLQAKDGNSLLLQEKLLREAGAETIITDDYSGAKDGRYKFDDLINKLVTGDKLIVTKLDRFARTATQGNAIIDDLLNKGVAIHILNIGLLDTSTVGKLLRQVLLSFAEFERDCIVERTQAGKELARQKTGFKEGRPKKYKPKQLDHAIELIQTHTYAEIEKITGISVPTIKREVKSRLILHGKI